MSLPDYQKLMLPVLTVVGAAGEADVAGIREKVAGELGISEADRALTHPRGTRIFDNRVHWAVTYLSQAKLLTRVGRGVVAITDRGKVLLDERPATIDRKLLTRFEEFRGFMDRARRKGADPEPTTATSETPKDRVESAIEEVNAALADDLLTRIRQREPLFFERLVLVLLKEMGYGAPEHLGRSGDEGVDGVIRQDALGLDLIYVQAKRYAENRTVGRPDIQAFVGALQGQQADRGVFITTSRFSNEARQFARHVAARVVLIDGLQLGDLLVTHNVGVQTEASFQLKRLDEDFFESL
ncbi:restriction endonuclease [Actinoplanes friuliensis]|uniref:5-methylcytosine-specific restriction endonuclease n=1 Tax=Actinoplanes friuliensis DSM 7358 TaxID=1246995 RepID=U5W404_9ACTN|nr:restriction endonuclease [Actinoplanes friuliensis]AGZ43864.1 5-methylcytosine-specific restriction endonuclease [Actinoplanes friuliensis DSM 7358]